MDKQHKKWTKKIQGNRNLLQKVKNPLRLFIQQEIKKIDLSAFPNRPTQIIDLSIGDPTNSIQFKTHPSSLSTLINNTGKIDGYTKFVGSDEARESVANMFQASNYKVSKQNVILTHGGSLALWSCIMALANQGDNFLFPSPGFPLSYAISASMGIEMKLYHLDPLNRWEVNIKQMESLIDNRTKFILVNDPSNPLGSCWSEKHKKEIIDLARKYNLPIVADEIYQGVTYGQSSRTFAELSTTDVTVLKCSGLTKRWFGPGWRMGWIIIYTKEELFSSLYTPLKNINNILLMPNTIVQASIKQILGNPVNEEYLKSRMEIMARNQKILKENLSQFEYCLVGEAEGALYATILLKMEYFNEKTGNILEFTKKFYAQENVMIFPGVFFGSELTFIRLVISCQNSLIEQFTVRFKRFCEKHLEKREKKEN